jgi:hypothetical protein
LVATTAAISTPPRKNATLIINTTGVNVRVQLSKTRGENMFLFVHAKPFMSEYNKIYIKAKRKIPILYCTANQLIEVKVSFAFGYRIGSVNT